MISEPRFALNHMAARRLPLADFFKLAADLELDAVEIRNDLADNAILDGAKAEEIRRLADTHALQILSINALQQFDRWTPEREGEAIALADYAAEAGAAALVLVPCNDGGDAGLDEALAGLAPILATRGLTGLVEPLGFASSSLRSKSLAGEAILRLGNAAPFRLLHDTFHHHVAGEIALCADLTGLVHVSGVTDPALARSDMLDDHRGLVDTDDQIANLEQLRGLFADGFDGPISLEPFSKICDAADPGPGLAACLDYLRREMRTSH